MRKYFHHRRNYRNAMYVLLILFFILPIILSWITISPKEKNVIKTKAATVTAASGIAGIQQAIDSAKDGDVITIPPGTYSGPTAVPLASKQPFANDSRGASDTCMLRIENKKFTIKGYGAIIFGEGHDKPYMDPYQHRAGICILNSNITIDGLRVKEFQKRCVVAVDSTIVYKNGIVDGCDEGGISMLGNSSGLILNNMIVGHNFGGVMLWQNTQAKIINNLFHNAGIMFFYHPKTDDKAHAEIINNIFNGGEESVNQVDWWKEDAAKLKTNKLSFNLFLEKKDCNPVFHFCDSFNGKMFGDPLYIEPVVDPRGIAAWANFGFKEGSPAVGVGDPSISGPKNLGNTGGPCADPNSSICSSFVQSNIPKPYSEPTPTSMPEITQPIDNQINNQTDSQNQETGGGVENTTGNTQYVTNEVGPQPTLYNNVFSREQGVVFVENISKDKTIFIEGMKLESTVLNIQKEVNSTQSIKYSFKHMCNGLALRVTGALLYRSGEDQQKSLRYKTLDLDCYKTEIIDIE